MSAIVRRIAARVLPVKPLPPVTVISGVGNFLALAWSTPPGRWTVDPELAAWALSLVGKEASCERS